MAHYNCIRRAIALQELAAGVIAESIPSTFISFVKPTRSRVTHFVAKKKQFVYGTRQNLIAFFMLGLVSLAPEKVIAQKSVALRIGLVTRINPAPGAISVARGVKLGAAEAKETATLFGANVLLFEQRVAQSAESAAAELLSERKVQVIIGSSTEDADALSRFADQHGVIFFNAASRSSTLRAECRPHTFHVEASDAMYANAGRPTDPRSRAGDSTVLWAGSLEKYGASQINDRFLKSYHVPMDGSAWAGWVAVKIAAEAALRAQSTRTASLLSYLEAAPTTFDGHKGWPLSFRPGDHQLRQPLYVVTRSPESRGQGFRDVPQLSSLNAAAGANANQLLDQLMPRTAGCVRNRT